jgi:hypothetical protein
MTSASTTKTDLSPHSQRRLPIDSITVDDTVRNRCTSDGEFVLFNTIDIPPIIDQDGILLSDDDSDDDDVDEMNKNIETIPTTTASYLPTTSWWWPRSNGTATTIGSGGNRLNRMRENISKFLERKLNGSEEAEGSIPSTSTDDDSAMGRRLQSAWNNVRYGWKLKHAASFEHESPIWLLGRMYHPPLFGRYSDLFILYIYIISQIIHSEMMQNFVIFLSTITVVFGLHIVQDLRHFREQQ